LGADSGLRFSVLICTHNRSALLARALDAVGRQRVRPGCEWEIVVVDNASRDDTARVVEAFGATATVPVRYLSEPRLGHSISLNTGIAACRGEIVASTDDDGCPDPSWIDELQRGFDQYHADWVFGRVVPLWDGRAPAWFSERFNGVLALIDYGPEPFVVHDLDHPFYGVNHAARRDVLLELGGYREDWGPRGTRGSMGADIDLFERAVAAGKRVVYQPRAVVGHLIPAARRTKQYQRRRIWVGVENTYPFLRDTASSLPWLLGLPRYLYRQAIDDFMACIVGLLRRDRSAAFFRELQLIRFVGLLYQGMRYKLRQTTAFGRDGRTHPDASRADGAERGSKPTGSSLAR